MSDAKLLRIFSTPVILDQRDDAAEINAALEASILARQKEDEGVSRSNRGGWQSKRDFRSWAGEAGAKVIEQAVALANAHTTRAPPVERMPWSVDVWANVNRGGDFNMPHVHGGTFWSAVYYVRVDDGEGGELTLHDPRMPALRMHAPGFGFKDAGGEYSVKIQPRAGLMVLFPAWLSHSVELWDGEGVRISVAMNIRAAMFQARQAKTAAPQ